MRLAGRLLCSSEFLNNQKAHPGILKLIIDKMAKVKKKFFKFSIKCEKLFEDISKVYEHLQQIHLQRPDFCGPPEFWQLAAKLLAARPNAATFLPLAALLLTAGHLQ